MKAHVFIDAENISPEIGFQAVAKFRRDYTICRADIIGKRETLSSKYLSAGTPYHFQNCYYGKNSADTWLCVEIAKTIFEETEVEAIIIVSSDRDFLPAIKLAVEKNKTIILVSNGEGHRNFKKLLSDLKINYNAVQLVDYRSDLELSDDDKKILSEMTEINKREQKLQTFYRRMSKDIKNFFWKREKEIKFIFIKHMNKISEVPFVNGIQIYVFQKMLRDLKVIDKYTNVGRLATRNFLSRKNRKIYLKSGEEMIPDDFVEENFSELENLQTIFINCNGELVEIPFVAGIDYQDFVEILNCFGIVGDVDFINKVITESLLEISADKKIYCAID